jgi:integrase
MKHPPSDSGAHKGITTDSFDSTNGKFQQSYASAKMWVIESDRAPLTIYPLVRLSNVEGDLYFPPYRSHVRGKPTKTYAGWSKDKKAFDKRCGVSKWTLHDLHRTFATKLAELGVLPHVVERLLNHRRALSKLKTF